MKRVAAYCRVSTEADDQLNSLENQKRYFEKYIENNIEWEFCGLYIDEGLSGTSVDKREGFKRMVADAENKKFDLLLTKEISRFARNTLDSIFYTRKLKGLGVGVVFMNDNINTLDSDAELRLTIMSSIAQEESRKTSERVKWGQKRLMERGVAFGAKALGYNLKHGKLTINEDEAKIIRLIFDLYLSGMGAHNISKELDNRGIPTPNGGTRWNAVRVLRILKNEKYIGVLKQKKKITVDYLSHKRKTNEGEENFIIVENSHAPIIEKEIFDRVQNEIVRRKNVTVEKSRYSNRHVWSGKVKCAYCNSSFKRKINNSTSNSPQIIWQCSEAEKYGKEKINAQGKKVGCNCKIVPEWVLRENFLAVLNVVIENKDFVVRELKERVRRAIAECPNKGDELKEVLMGLDKLSDRKSRLIEMHLDRLISLTEYKKAYAQYEKQQQTLQKRLSVLDGENKLAADLEQKLDSVDQAIENLARLIEFGDSICSEVLHKVVVEGRDKMSFYLTTGENKNPAFFKIPLLIRQDL
ncbi:recombinase family protein [Candidatus Bathycorpusculum sp.]|uniref:recombinase family protein n=1 Tax=Candidatus Bathycorpusculum sp. TaxID=2994959 RepID=UPI002822745C|nr:recombinase family protein [Candidatus Termitimicrobium sp.]MCL2684992.1 recombinase family protein [Candidatus Termitimicrobium sp.]